MLERVRVDLGAGPLDLAIKHDAPPILAMLALVLLSAHAILLASLAAEAKPAAAGR